MPSIFASLLTPMTTPEYNSRQTVNWSFTTSTRTPTLSDSICVCYSFILLLHSLSCCCFLAACCLVGLLVDKLLLL